MSTVQVPGVQRVEMFPAPSAPLRHWRARIPGSRHPGAGRNASERLDLWPQFGELFGGSPKPDLWRPRCRASSRTAARSATSSGSTRAVDPVVAVQAGLDASATLDDVDLVGVPDASRLRRPGELPTLEPDPVRVQTIQRAVIDHCELVGTRVAILDSIPNAGQFAVLEQRRALTSSNATLYYPWILVQEPPTRPPPSCRPAGTWRGSMRRPIERSAFTRHLRTRP